jgi:hypothetical protein
MDYRDNNPGVLTMGVLTGIALAISIISGSPWVRNSHHKCVAFLSFKLLSFL